MARRVVGRWRITEMDLSDRDSIDLVGPAFIEITTDGHGSFRFIAVEGFIGARGHLSTVAQRWSSVGTAMTKETVCRVEVGPARGRWLTAGPPLHPPR
jgi:hypothetical protein